MKKGFVKGGFAIAVLGFGLAACNAKKLSPIPQISNPRLSDSLIHVGLMREDTDTLLLTFDFEDGDGDISGSIASLFFQEELDSGAQLIPYPFPEIQEGTIDPDKGARGAAYVVIPATAPLFPVLDSAVTRDTVRFRYYLKDAAGNQSNTLITPNIILLNP